MSKTRLGPMGIPGRNYGSFQRIAFLPLSKAKQVIPIYDAPEDNLSWLNTPIPKILHPDSPVFKDLRVISQEEFQHLYWEVKKEHIQPPPPPPPIVDELLRPRVQYPEPQEVVIPWWTTPRPWVASHAAGVTPILKVQVKTAQSSASSTISGTFSTTTILGNLLIGVINHSGNQTITPPTGWVLARREVNGTATTTSIYYRENAPATSSAVTFTFSSSPLSATMVLLEYSGLLTLGSLDKVNGTTGSSTSPSSGSSGTTSTDHELVIVGLGSQGQTTYTSPTNSFTIAGQIFESIDFFQSSVAVLEREVSAIGDYNSGATSGNLPWSGVIATFKGTGAFLPPDSPTQRQRQEIYPSQEYTYSWWDTTRRVPLIPIVAAPEVPKEVVEVHHPLAQDFVWWDVHPLLSSQSRLLAQVKPPTKQGSQVFHSLPDLNFLWWVYPVPLSSQASALAQIKPPTKQGSQQWDHLPDDNILWWEIFPSIVSQGMTYTPPPLRGLDQTLHTLPDLNFLWWEQLTHWPEIIEPPTPPAPDSPLSRQSPQQLFQEQEDLSKLWWDVWAAWPIPVVGQQPPEFPPTRQPSQEWYQLEDGTYIWWEPNTKAWPVPLPDFQQFSLPSQNVDPAPEFPWWEVWGARPQPVHYLPPPAVDQPTSRQGSQTFYPLPDLNSLWWEQWREWPVPVQYIPEIPKPPTKQGSQVWFQQPDYTAGWVPWMKYPRFTPPSHFSGIVSQEGIYRILNTFSSDRKEGKYRIQNEIAGYVVYVEVGMPPDLDGPPTLYTTTLPVSIPVTLPTGGLKTFYVVIRKRDRYGLVSQNQRSTKITIDNLGNLVLPDLPAPVSVQAIAMSGVNIRVLALYPDALSVEDPADEWYIWVSVGPPPVSTEPPTRVLTVRGPSVLSNFQDYEPGTYQVAVALHRTSDGDISPATIVSVTIPEAPPKPGSVHGGYEEGY